MRIVASDLTVSYGNRAIFTELNFTVEARSMVALMGPSGVGKSSLLAAIAGRLTPSSGEVRIEDGDDPVVDWLVQSTPLLTRRSALDNAVLGALAAGVPYSEAEERARSALERLALSHRQDARVSTLSGGERQRVAIARTLAADTSLILADEPTASLDASARRAVCEALVKVKERGGTVIVATHDPIVADFCDDVIRLDAGDAVG